MHFINNVDLSSIDKDKLFKIRPIIEAIRNECVKLELEEYQAVDYKWYCVNQKELKSDNTTLKKPKIWGF